MAMPKDGKPEQHDSYGAVALSTPTEVKLGAIWSKLLNIEDVRADDNFIALGGESITATYCLYLIREIFQVDLTLSVMLTETKSLTELAVVIDQLRGGATETDAARQFWELWR
jgi:hypothetical protein